MDQSAKDALKTHEENNPDFIGTKNNCTDYVESGVEATGAKIDAEEKVLGITATTPNKLYKEVSQLPNATIVKDPGPAVNNSFRAGVGGAGAEEGAAIAAETAEVTVEPIPVPDTENQ